MAVMARHVTKAELQRAGMAALVAACETMAGRCAAGDAGALHTVVAALRAHPDCFEVQMDGLSTLYHLCIATTHNAAAARTSGAFAAATHALRAPPGTDAATHAALAQRACIALAAMVGLEAPGFEAALSAGAIEAIIAAQRAHAANGDVQEHACYAMSAVCGVLGGGEENKHAAVAAGGLEAAVAALRRAHSWPAELRTRVEHDALVALITLTTPEHDDAALRAGALEVLPKKRIHNARVNNGRDRLKQLLDAAAARHDDGGGVCAHAARCARCAAGRAAGAVCALPSCGARRRADGSGKKLLRCAACGVASYCSPAHQKDDWAQHKGGCGGAPAAASADRSGA
jgi:hypothetical protein